MYLLEIVAQIATDVTACVAVYGYGSYRLTIHRRVRAVEKALKALKALSTKTPSNDDSLSVQQLAIQLTLTEDQVIDAAGRSKIIESCTGPSGDEYRFRIKRISNPATPGLPAHS